MGEARRQRYYNAQVVYPAFCCKKVEMLRNDRETGQTHMSVTRICTDY
ncbi:hypothetical protein I6N90_00740 [Paenibacillus sp. GSMTC-2017]|nr:hypothetical protein [Paenibacillus sp. GSMTC-2017]MBH5316333.1 hypothetical protein [Paenibacillus sp. GSMTC-2017]